MKARHAPCLLVLAASLAAAPALAEQKADKAFKGDRELGEYLANECVTCHQPSGRIVGGIPAIIGWPEDQFLAVMHSFKRRERDNQVMQTMASRLSEEEMLALAAYFGTLPVPAASK